MDVSAFLEILYRAFRLFVLKCPVKRMFYVLKRTICIHRMFGGEEEVEQAPSSGLAHAIWGSLNWSNTMLVSLYRFFQRLVVAERKLRARRPRKLTLEALENRELMAVDGLPGLAANEPITVQRGVTIYLSPNISDQKMTVETVVPAATPVPPDCHPTGQATGNKQKLQCTVDLSGEIHEAQFFSTIRHELGANLARIQVVWWNGFPLNRRPLDDVVNDKTWWEDYEIWRDAAIKSLEVAVDAADREGLQVIVDLHTPPGGGRLNDRLIYQDSLLFHDGKNGDRARKVFKETWKAIANAVGESRAVIGFDLQNEPSWKNSDAPRWREIVIDTARAIRKIDRTATIIVETRNGIPTANHVPLLDKREFPNTVYSTHMYQPKPLFDGPAPNTYPSVDPKWDSEYLADQLKKSRVLQLRSDVPIYIGEFSAPWGRGDSADAYLQDLTDLMSKYNWAWTYHSIGDLVGQESGRQALLSPMITDTEHIRQAHIELKPKGQLVINGTDMADSVQVGIKTDFEGEKWVVVTMTNRNWERAYFRRDAVKKIKFHGGKGDDVFFNATRINSTIKGGIGDDWLTGGGGKDRIVGGAGDDGIFGRGGNDTLKPGPGRNTVDGGTDRDTHLKHTHGNDKATNVELAPFIVVSTDIGIDLADDLLSIVGTSVGDSIIASRMEDQVLLTVDNEPFDIFANDDFSAIEFFGGAGDDTFVNSTSKTLAAYGGVGNDRLVGGDAADALYGGAGNDVIIGGAGADSIFGDSGNDWLEGSDGDDRIVGGDDRDTVWGQNGADVLEGGAGDDRINGGAQNDRIFGQAGNDFIDGASWHDVIYGGEGRDTINGGTGNDQIFGDAGNDDLRGADGDDRIVGGSGADSIRGQNGGDTLEGGLGNDWISGGAQNDRILGQAGDDRIYGGSWHDTIYGGEGDDVISGDSGNDRLFGDNGNDWIHAGLGIDSVIGGRGHDVIYGYANNNILVGGIGNDTIHGGVHNDVIHGDAGNDVIYANRGADRVSGGDGDDRIFGGAHGDVLKGDAGNDAIAGGEGNDQLHGGTGNDHLDGEAGDDHIAGNAGADHLFGGLGHDTLLGGVGNDRIRGGHGNDHIRGEQGNDVLLGGEGNDFISAGAGNDHAEGGKGTDTMHGGSGHDHMEGGGGNDSLFGDSGNDTILGGKGDDVILGGSGVDHMNGGAGYDIIERRKDRFWRRHGYYRYVPYLRG